MASATSGAKKVTKTAAAAKTATATATKTATAAKAKESGQRLKRAQRAAILLKQVSDPTRLQVILMLSEGERHVGGSGDELSQSQPAVSHHLALLRHGGIIVAPPSGQEQLLQPDRDRRRSGQGGQINHGLSLGRAK